MSDANTQGPISSSSPTHDENQQQQQQQQQQQLEPEHPLLLLRPPATDHLTYLTLIEHLLSKPISRRKKNREGSIGAVGTVGNGDDDDGDGDDGTLDAYKNPTNGQVVDSARPSGNAAPPSSM